MSRVLHSLREAITVVTTMATIRVSISESSTQASLSDASESVEPFEDEPMQNCLCCGERVPVHDLRHFRNCRRDPKNYTCPYCKHVRTPRTIEAHINECGSRMASCRSDIEHSIFAHRSSDRNVETVMETFKEQAKNNYKYTLLTTILPPCLCSGCLDDTRRAIEWDAFLRAEQEYNNLTDAAIRDYFLPIHNMSLNAFKNSSKEKTIKRIKAMYVNGCREISVTKKILDQDARETEKTIRKLRDEKIATMNRIQERYKRILFRECIEFRDQLWAALPAPVIEHLFGCYIEIEAVI